MTLSIREYCLLAVLAVGCSSVLLVNQACAQSEGKFVPSETEWAVWPQYCKARYVDIPLGQATQYAGRMSRTEISNIESAIGTSIFRSIHHYCFGIGYMMRAQRLSPIADSRDYKFLLRSVLQEANFTFQRIPLSNPVAANVAYLTAQAHSLLGESVQAVKVLENVIEQQPKLPDAYVALALLYRSEEKPAKSIEVLEEALDRVESASAELYYTAAISYLELNQLELSQRFAIKAYDLGYPFPGLKRKLAEKGYWPSDSSDPDRR